MVSSVFRPCIDLHEGKVKQIVGGTLSDTAEEVRTNFVADKIEGAEYAALYRDDGLRGGHVILLGPGQRRSGSRGLAAYPGAYSSVAA